jgi:tetratricopeptide (TPR) repeat protein
MGSATAGFVLHFARRHEEAIDRARKTVEFDSTFFLGYIGLGHPLLLLERFDEAIDAYERARVLSDDNCLAMAWLAAANVLAGRRQRGTEVLAELLAMSQVRYISPACIAIPLFALGDGRRALEYLRAACEGRDPFALFWKAMPGFELISDDESFREAVEMVGIWG